MMESVIHFAVSAAAIFYDGFSGKIISPGTLTFCCDDRIIKPVVKEDRYAVFTNIFKGDTAIKVTSPFYCDELLTISNGDSPDGVIHISLYPCSAYPHRQGTLTLEGQKKNLLSLNLIGVKKPLWLRLGDYNDKDGTLQVANLLGNRIPTEIGLYLADKQRFYTAKLGQRRPDGRCAIKGSFTKSDLARASPVKLYKAQVAPSGAFFLLADSMGGEYIAAFQYAKKTEWETYVENGDKLILKGGG